MPVHLSRATTRSTASIVDRLSGAALLARDQQILSPESRLAYRVGPFLGRGGYGEVYLATRLGRSRLVPQRVCLKVSTKIDSWVHESYFGRLLEGHSRALQVFESFPIVGREGRPVYCLVLELATHGDLSSYLQRRPRPFPEATARRQIASILELLGKLHDRSMLHRDLTPFNVFVCDGMTLKLGDFGIAKQQMDRRGIVARTLNPFGAPKEFLVGNARHWQARDDVFQIGQLLGMLILGDASARIDTAKVRSMPCSDQLKEIIYRCIGHRHRRYEAADELIDALKAPVVKLRAGGLTSLAGVHLAFTGILSRPRREAIDAAILAGAIVHGGPSARTTVVVRGRPNPQQAAGPDAGIKLMELKRLRAKGHRITLIGEARFWKLVSRPRP